MKKVTWNEYVERTLGCWMGKNAGGTLGGPDEGKLGPLTLDWYPKIQEGGIPNDDLEVQLVWLHALETRGIHLTAEDLAAEWLDHYLPNWDEYGFGKTNVRKGLLPPMSGSFNNWFHQSMGCPIRSEIWACVAPGLPFEAARMAREDAVVDHGPESTYAEMLFAAIESAAFVDQDRDRLVELGLATIPDESRTSKAVRAMLTAWNATKDWKATRQAVLDAEGNHDNFTDAPQNIAFTLLGWYTSPDDFGQAICDAVNCGYDTDCTGATLGSIMGIAWGAGRLPDKWMKPLGRTLAIDKVRTRIFDAPATVDDLTDRTAAVAMAFFAGRGIAFGPGKSIDMSLPTPAELRKQIQDAGLWEDGKNLVERKSHHLKAKIRYGTGPVLAPGDSSKISITLTNTTERKIEGPVKVMALSEGLSVNAGALSIDLDPGQSSTVDFTAALSPQAKAQSHVEVVVAISGEGTAPWTFPVSFVRPMTWRLEKQAGTDFAPGLAEPSATKGNLVSINGNAIPLPDTGVWFGHSKVFNPSKHGREVRICAPSKIGVKAWLNGKQVVENPGSTRFRPSYHGNPEHHYGAGVLTPGWNRISVAWNKLDPKGETHFFLTTPGGAGWGDLVFEAEA